MTQIVERYLQDGNTEPPRSREPFVPALKCSHVKAMKIEGEWFESEKCTDPGCPVHGLEAVLLAKGRFTVEHEGDNPPVDLSGPYKHHRRENAIQRAKGGKYPIAF
jgi:hypothetical protein